MSFNVADPCKWRNGGDYFHRPFLVMGVLADPAKNLPGLFGPGATFNIERIRGYPYVLLSGLNAGFLLITLVVVFFGWEDANELEHFRNIDYLWLSLDPQ